MNTTIFVHSETKEGEIFIGNFDNEADVIKATGRDYKTLRLGQIAFNSGGAGTDPTKKPAFVKISEWEQFEQADFQAA